MKSDAVRKKFLRFFEKKGHAVVASSSLVPSNDSTVLLTTAGMQQFKPYFLGQKKPEADFGSRRLASAQKCFRTSDIDQVGDDSHLTFFEMLGNFSIGDYSKEEAIPLAWECLTKVFRLPAGRMWTSIFAGDERSSKDIESFKLWQQYLPAERISESGRSDNWWGPPGSSGPCGPSTEVHFDLTGKPCDRGDLCQPNCPCGRFLEIWNLVLMEYFQDESGEFSDLPTKNVDTGMGLERMLSVLQGKTSIYETDAFTPLISVIERQPGFALLDSEHERHRRLRIIADHLKGSTFLVADGVRFSNKEQGYVLRRVFRRALDQFTHPLSSFAAVVEKVITIYERQYPDLRSQQSNILSAMQEEASAYDAVVSEGLKRISRRMKKRRASGNRSLTADEAFEHYSTFGVPLDRLKRAGYQFDEAAMAKKIDQHKATSRVGAEKKFGGHGLEHGPDLRSLDPGKIWQITRLHTATHLLHAALRQILGPDVRQDGSDINPERLRFDFTFDRKLTDQEKRRVEELINEKIRADLPVRSEIIPYQQAMAEGALAYFKEKYSDHVKVYTIGDFSKELCGGPHVERTAQVGRFKITSEKSSSAGVRRIKAVVEDQP